MLPDHCKDVSVRKVDFQLTLNEIAKRSRDLKAYTRTDYIVLVHGDERAVVRVEKADGKDLFRPIKNVEIVSLPRDTVFLQDETIDVLNASQMAMVGRAHLGKTVVVQGMFGHISFAQSGGELELYVLDVVPPRPSKLHVLVERALGSMLADIPIIPLYEEIDLNMLESRVKTPAVIFPCEASGLRSEKKVYYLDQTPQISERATLIGCDLSERIHRSLYKSNIERIEMCPQELAPNDGKKRIVKCCRVREGFEIKGSTAIVPWGATVKEVSAAVVELFSHS